MIGTAEYRDFVDRLFVKRRAGADGFMHAAAGAAGEGGEILDIAKKHWVYGKPLDRAHMLEEIGDCLHYLNQLCILLGIRIEDAMAHNVAKLNKRYPSGYTDEAAIERADKANDGPIHGWVPQQL